MSEQPEDSGRISPDDVDAVAERLKEWMPTLPEQERQVMGWILTRAAAAGDSDVEAYAERTEAGVPISSLVADAAGVQDVAGYLRASGPGWPPPQWVFAG